MKSFVKFFFLIVSILLFSLCFVSCNTNYTITFVVDGEKFDSWEGLRENREVAPPTPKSKEGYIFDGWYIDSNMTEYFSSGNFNYNKAEHKNLTIYGKYVPEDEYVAKVKTIEEFYRAVKRNYNIELLSDIDAKDAGKFEGQDKTQSYKSVIDGKGHTISNLTVVDRAGVVYNNRGVIKNLNFANLKMLSSLDDDYYSIGGISVLNNGTIENCKVVGTMGFSQSGSYRSALLSDYFGCIAAKNNGIIKNCDAVVDFSTNINGISPYSYSGGITGCNYATVEGCSYTGTAVAMYRYAHLGGIAGANEGNIIDCVSAGLLSASTDTKANVGGIVGYNKSDSTIENSYSTTQISVSWMYENNVTYTAYVGGLAGYNSGNVSNSFFDGNLTTYNRPEREIYAGYIVGYNHGEVANAFYGENAEFAENTSCDTLCDAGQLTSTENLKNEAWISENLWESADKWIFDGDFPQLKR